jgi:hypothetical protein
MSAICVKVGWLPVDEQLRLKLRRFIETNIPELAGKIRVEVVSSDRQK